MKLSFFDNFKILKNIRIGLLLSALLASVLFFGFLPRFSDYSPGRLRFKSEKIVITVSPDRIKVEGRYIYESNWPVESGYKLVYPFPVGPDAGLPDEFRVSLLKESGKEPIEYSIKDDYSYYVVHSGLGRPAEVLVEYEQPLTGSKAVYLTQTTRSWKQPVEKAEFVVRLTGDLQRARLITPYGEIIDITGEKHFVYENFFPEGNFIVDWKNVL